MASNNGFAAQPTQNSVFKEFSEDRATIRSLGITPQEMDALSRASLLGALSCKEDVLFILEQLREKAKPLAAEKIELSISNAHERTESLRNSALTNLKKHDALIAKRNNPIRRFIRTLLRQRDLIALDDSSTY
jgi:citrate synthase